MTSALRMVPRDGDGDERDASTQAPERLLVRQESRYVVVPTATIDFVQADGNYVWIHTGDQSVRARMTVAAMRDQLDPTRFAQIHRSIIVNVERIVEVRRVNSDHVVTLSTGRTLNVGRTFASRLFQLYR